MQTTVTIQVVIFPCLNTVLSSGDWGEVVSIFFLKKVFPKPSELLGYPKNKVENVVFLNENTERNYFCSFKEIRER